MRCGSGTTPRFYAIQPQLGGGMQSLGVEGTVAEYGGTSEQVGDPYSASVAESSRISL
jgi:hypothetical protein